jgi:hypothetical protein
MIWIEKITREIININLKYGGAIMRIKERFLLMLLLLTLLIGCSTSTLKNAEFTNVTPAEVKINDTVYLMTEDIVFEKDMDKQIGKVTKVNAIVSYIETDNPYKNPNKIYKIKNKNIEEVIAIQVNDKIYKATAKESSK